MDARWLSWLPESLRIHIAGRHEFQAILGNTGWLFSDRVVRMGLGLIINVWMARYLGPDQFGEFNYAIAFASFFSVAASLGLDSVVVRELVRHPGSRSEIFATTFALKLLGGALAFVAALAVVWLVRPGDSTTFWLVAVIAAGIVFQASDTVDLWFQSQTRSKYAVYARIVAFFCIFGVKIWLILSEAKLIAFAWAGLAEVMIAAVGLVVVYRSAGNEFTRLALQWPLARRLLSESWPLVLSGLAVVLYMRLDIVMLREMSGEHEAGIYAAAVRLSEIWYFLPVLITSSTFPAIINSRSTDLALYTSRLRKVYFVVFWLAIGVALPLSLLSDSIVSLLYGPRFIDAAPVLAIQLWASVAVFLGVASSQYLLAEQLQTISFYRTLIGLICNVVLNLLLIPGLGALGAAIATVVSYFAATFSLVFFSPTRLHVAYLLMAPFRRR